MATRTWLVVSGLRSIMVTILTAFSCITKTQSEIVANSISVKSFTLKSDPATLKSYGISLGRMLVKEMFKLTFELFQVNIMGSY